MQASASFTITHITDGLTTFYEYAQSTSNTIPPTSGWNATVPAAVAGKFIWRREGTALTRAAVTSWHLVCLTGDTGSQGPKGDKGDTGAQGAKGDKGDTGEPGEPGPMGNPGAVGVNTDGSKIQVAGFDEEGSFGTNTGVIYAGTQKLQIPFTEYTCTQDGKGYIVITRGSTIEFVTLTPAGTQGQGVIWQDFNSGEEISPNFIIGRFTVHNSQVTEASLDIARPTAIFIKANLMELLIEANETGDAEQLKVMAIAMGADRVFQTIVADEGFFRELWVSKIQSDNFATNSDGSLKSGFMLDGASGKALITDLEAKDAKISGSFSNTGFRTLDPNPGAAIDPATVSPTVYKQTDMYALIPSADALQSINGTIEGKSFSEAVRKENSRILLVNNTSSTEVSISAGDFKVLKKETPTSIFGRSYWVEWHFDYTGNMSDRLLLRVGSGDSQTTVRNEWFYSETHTWEVEIERDGVIETETRSETVYPNQPQMQLWKSSKGSGNYSGTYDLTAERNSIGIYARSGAWWGTQPAKSNKLKIWTSRTFNSIVLVNGSKVEEITRKLGVYHLASSNPFTIGGTNQNSSSMKKYCSGTDFYNLFNSLPVGSVGEVGQGKIEIDGIPYTVARLQKTSDRITFWTDKGEKTVQKFVDGTDTGVYTSLKITQKILFAPIEGGIESMHILPINDAHNLYDVGHSSYRFRAGYFVNLYAKLTGDVVGNVNPGGAGNNQVWGAVFN